MSTPFTYDAGLKSLYISHIVQRVSLDDTSEAHYVITDSSGQLLNRTVTLPAADWEKNANLLLAATESVSPLTTQDCKKLIRELIRKATDNPPVTQFHCDSPGYWKINGSWKFVTAAGAISATGVDKHIRTISNPDIDTSDADRLIKAVPNALKKKRVRQSFEHVLKELGETNGRLFYEIISQPVWQLLTGTQNGLEGFITHFHAPTGSGKTALARQITMFFGVQHSCTTSTSLHSEIKWQGTTEKGALESAGANRGLSVTLDDYKRDVKVDVDMIIRLICDRSQPNVHSSSRVKYAPIRAYVMSNGEVLFRSAEKSLQARMVVIEVPELSEEQKSNSDIINRCNAPKTLKHYTTVGAALIVHILQNWDTFEKDLSQALTDLAATHRDNFPNCHTRLPRNISSLIYAAKLFLKLAKKSGAISPEEYKWHKKASLERFIRLGRDQQASWQREISLKDQLETGLIKALQSGHYHLCHPKQDAPPVEQNSERFGWCPSEGAKGVLIGTYCERREKVMLFSTYLDPGFLGMESWVGKNELRNSLQEDGCLICPDQGRKDKQISPPYLFHKTGKKKVRACELAMDLCGVAYEADSPLSPFSPLSDRQRSINRGRPNG